MSYIEQVEFFIYNSQNSIIIIEAKKILPNYSKYLSTLFIGEWILFH